MNTRFSKTGSLPFLFALATFAIALTAVAQLSDVPPVSMGLWQSETNATVTGLENTPMAAMAATLGRAHASQSCLTPESWKKGIEGVQNQQQRGCTLTNVHQDAHEISFDEACDSGGGSTSSSHIDMLIDSSENAHGTVLTKVTEPRLPQPMNINMSIVSHFVSSNCGDVKPGEGKMIK
jgi:hypothetical protein